MYIRDLQGNEYYLQGTIKHDQELNGDERIDMDIHYTDINAEFLQKKEDLNMWIIIFEDKEYRIISTKQTGHGDKYTVSVTGILYILDWLNTHRIYRRIDASLTNYEAFKLLFDDTPFSFNIVDASYSNQFEGLGEGQTRLEMFKTFLDRYDYEMDIVGNVVYLKNKVGNDANFEYRYKVNANNISKDSDAGELWTYAQGYGNYSDDEEGKDVVDKAQLKREYTSPLESVIGERREAPPIRDGRITQQNTMDNALKKLVDESMQISFTADIEDMRTQGYQYQVATIGDRVFLVDERIGLDTEIRVVKISRTVTDMGQLLDIQITFGTSSNADNYSSNLTTAVKDITDIMKGRKSIPFTALDTVSKSMVSKIQNTSSELLFDDTGIHAIDKKNANNIVTMNSSGWMLSTDGGRTAKTALTAEGIVADTITTGHLNTQLVSVVGKEGYFFIDGDMLMAKDPDSLSQTVLNPKGLQITRPDGGVYMVNGIPNVSMEVQKNPLYYPSVEFDGINYRTKETEFQTFEYFYASHDGRYLVVSFAAGLAWDSEDASSTVSILLEEFGEESKGIKAVKTFDFKKGDPDIFSTITIDLGVPTYRNMRFYLKFKKGTGGSNNIATIRTTRICMKG
ncbi:phage tail protein [Staphylococcus simulans]|uniref:phage tail protein n=1 Tax=Staphylococcus simulans TaxID=1286 RepID=UPI0021D353E0|nr:phage tail protein [Staphylococcus simulans]UXR53575.1 phage tail protein [Staphylococcus simulans]